MKQIVDNLFLEIVKFENLKQMTLYIDFQSQVEIFNLEYTSGDYYYCCVFSDSLTLEKKYIITFSADNDENISVLNWYKYQIFILNTGSEIYLIKNYVEILKCYSIQTSLIGLSIISDRLLLILEECSFTTISNKGDIVKQQSLSFIENFRLNTNILILDTDDGEMSFTL